jgi:hypothetical protein
MLGIALDHKIKVSFGMLLLTIAAVSIAINSSNAISDGISISVATLLSVGILAILPSIVMDLIHAICNP